MTRSIGSRAILGLLVAALAGLTVPDQLRAQGGDGYLLKRPVVTFKVETGYGFQRANSDIFDFVTERHTLDRRDFDSPYLGGELAVRVTERFDVALGVGFASASTLSEFREFIGTDDLPIEQVTELRQIPLTVSAKYYPFDRGRQIGRFAWIPRTVAPFLSAGAGLVSYRFEQQGEFVDFETLDIFADRFVSKREAFLARVGAGVNISLNQQFLVSAEGRYSWADARMDGNFDDFDPIDLDGFQLVAGIGVRF